MICKCVLLLICIHSIPHNCCFAVYCECMWRIIHKTQLNALYRMAAQHQICYWTHTTFFFFSLCSGCIVLNYKWVYFKCSIIIIHLTQANINRFTEIILSSKDLQNLHGASGGLTQTALQATGVLPVTSIRGRQIPRERLHSFLLLLFFFPF